jgi:hypothetical protein
MAVQPVTDSDDDDPLVVLSQPPPPNPTTAATTPAHQFAFGLETPSLPDKPTPLCPGQLSRCTKLSSLMLTGQLKAIVLPMNVDGKGNHWWLLVVDFQARCFRWGDSLAITPRTKKDAQLVIDWVDAVAA